MCRHMVGASQRLAGRQESCRDSWVCALTSKWQVGVLLGEHRGWILRMATLIKGRLSDNRPEACGASFQTKKLRTFACFPLIKECSISPLQSRRLCTASSRRLAEQGQSLVLAGY